jgi:signal transduction histidine kinase
MKILRYLLLLLTPVCGLAQVNNVDSLRHVVASTKSDAAKIHALRDLSDYYIVFNTDSGVKYAELLRTASIKAHNKSGEGYAIGNIAGGYSNRGNSAKALELSLKALQIFKESKDSADMANEYIALGQLYLHQGNKVLAYQYVKNGWYISNKVQDYSNMFLSATNLGDFFIRENKLDSAMFYIQQAVKLHKEHPGNLALTRAAVLEELAMVYFRLHQYDRAGATLTEALQLALKQHDPEVSNIQLTYADFLLQMHKPDSALVYALKVSGQLQKKPELTLSVPLYYLLSNIYKEKKQFEQAYKYHVAFIAARDSLYSTNQSRKFESMVFNERQREADVKNAALAYQNKLKQYGTLLALILVLIIAGIIWRNYRKQQIANSLLESQKQQIETTLTELRSAQSQLIQSEKMASLGELTAGIAHEIQNPLNFVNNFSEVNTELIDEMKNEIRKGNLDDGLAIADDIKENEQKINMHGKRADSIVKSMLEHSRVSNGQKELTDLNTLADEYMRLSYHGLRAKDKTFNSAMDTHLDGSLPNVNVIPQDIGRVLLNLFNNAFYAVHQKKKQNPEKYLPQVTLTTTNKDGFIEITVSDNGNGIPENIKDKIMQPFFTTKPTGDGTGLGLSLSYDIVVKGHGGSINVISKEGEGSEFIIKLRRL